jgi:hypothetical protein
LLAGATIARETGLQKHALDMQPFGCLLSPMVVAHG